MMDKHASVVVTSRSFSKHEVLRTELLARFPNTTFNDEGRSLNGDDLVKFLKGHERAIIALETVDENLLSCLPDLQHISKYGVGLNNIDQDAVEQFGKTLAWTPGVNKRSVSELALCFMLSLLRHTAALREKIKAGDFSIIKGSSLSNQTVGIVGCGNIGKDLITLLKPFGCQVLANDIVSQEDFYIEHGVTSVSLEELLSRSDVVTLHIPLNTETRNLIGQREIALMKSSAILINTARGGIVDEDALLDALVNEDIAGAALDVFAVEPPPQSELFNYDNVLFTPHIGGSTEEAILAMGRAAIAGLDRENL